MNPIIWYDCPKCGKPKSCDGEHFCGSCEEQYRKEVKAQDQFKSEEEMYDYFIRLNE